MQKHARYNKNEEIITIYTPLPADEQNPLYYDKEAVSLPFSESFPKLHYHDQYEIGICESGEGLFLSEGIFYYVNEGDLIFIPPKHRHYSRSVNRDVLCKCRFTYFSKNIINRFLLYHGIDTSGNNIPAVLSPSEFSEAAEMLKRITEITQTSFPEKEKSIALRLSVFLLESNRWFDNFGIDSDYSLKHGSPACVKIAEYLSLHYKNNDTAKELAQMCYLSESQLRRQFVSTYGIPPIEFRGMLRCKIAKQLLLRTTVSINNISDNIGYSSPSDFYRMFRKFYGISPSEFRKKHSI